MFERFTDRARRVLVLAQEQARALRHNFIGTEHILLGLLQEGEGVAARTLGSLDISLAAVQDAVVHAIGAGELPVIGAPPFTPRAKKVLELSLREALQLGHNYIGTEHMLLGLLREGEGVGARVLVTLGTDLASVRQRVVELVSGARPDLAAVDSADVTPAEHPLDPAVLLTPAEVEAVLIQRVLVESVREGSHGAGGIDYLTRSFQPHRLPEVSIAVADATVSRAAFDVYATRHTARRLVAVDGVGDAATFEEATGALRVLRGSTLFVVSVRHHSEALAAATSLARTAAARVPGV